MSYCTRKGSKNTILCKKCQKIGRSPPVTPTLGPGVSVSEKETVATQENQKKYLKNVNITIIGKYRNNRYSRFRATGTGPIFRYIGAALIRKKYMPPALPKNTFPIASENPDGKRDLARV